MTNTLSSSISTGITLTTSGNYQSPFTITSTGTVATAYTDGVYGSATSGLTLINDGVINGGSYSTGVALNGGGSFSNNGKITGGDNGVAVGLYGAGTFNANNSGLIAGGTGTNGPAGNAVVIYDAGGLFSNSGTIEGGTLANKGIGVVLGAGTLLNSGLIAGGTNLSGTQADAVLFSTNASTLIVEHGATFTGNVVANATVSDVLAIGGTAPVYLANIGAKYQNFHTLAFETGATGTASGTFTAMDATAGHTLAVTGFTLGDTLILGGFAATSDTYVSGIGLELGNGTSEITLDITGNFTTTNFNVIDTPTNTTISLNPPCFAHGTRILTTRGEIPVEQLRTGDSLILHSGGTAPIQWIGHRSLAPARHPNPEQINPIRITAGALQNNIPHRDLVLSPDHALYLNGALIPAKSLLNGTTIRQESRRSVTYYHIELAHHAVLYAEGTPAESYLETGNRHAFSNGGSALTLHPDFAQTLREQTSCAPFAESGPIVEQTRAQILARTHQPLTTDPALTLHTNQDGSVTIHSRSGIPGYFSPDPRDQRTLGVKILSLRAGAQKIPLDHPLLTAGWHTPEPDGRWTNGRGIIPAALAKGGPITLELAATTQYPTQHPKRQSA